MSELNHLFETDSITVSDREEVIDRTIKDYERVYFIYKTKWGIKT